MSFATMVRGLNRARVDYVVIGGVAAAAHGSVRVTNDLDICYSTAERNVERLARLLARWKSYPRGVERGLPFIMDAVTMRACPVLTLTTAEGDLDLFDRVAGVGDHDDADKASERFEAFGTRFSVLGLDALIKAKRAAARPRDLEHLVELEAIAALRKKIGA